jgi:hypothetical protein
MPDKFPSRETAGFCNQPLSGDFYAFKEPDQKTSSNRLYVLWKTGTVLWSIHRCRFQ